MSMRYGVLCFLLIMMVVFLAIESYNTWTHPLEFTWDRGAIKKTETRVDNPPGGGVVKEPTPMKAYVSIAEKNIFNPERKDFPSTGAGISSRPIIRPSIILYGITIVGDYQSASIVHSGRPLKKGERELMTLKVGEKVGEYKLAKIFADRISLEAEGDTFEVSLYDAGVPKRRSSIKTESKPAAITSTLPTPTAPPPEVPKPRPQEVIEKPREPIPEKVTPPTLPQPGRPSFPPPSTRRRGGVYYPPSGSPTQPGGPMPQGVPAQGTEGSN